MTLRRSRIDMRTGRFLEIGQSWRHRVDGTIWRIENVHRRDCSARLKRGEHRLYVPFQDLRREWVWIAGTPRQEEETR